MARMTAAKVPSGRSPWLRAVLSRASGSRLQKCVGGRFLDVGLQAESGLIAIFGAPGGTRSAHVVQFRPVGVEGAVEELAPEGLETGGLSLSGPVKRR